MRDRSLNEARVGDVERAMAGDHDAFASLIGLAADSLFGMAVLILRDHARAEDATQEAIFRAWRELPRLRDPNRFAAWLRRLVVNACYDEGRRLRRRAEVPLVNVDIRSVGDGSGHLAERDQIERVFRRLPIDQRVVLVLAHHLDLSQAEIAALLGIPLGTAKSRLRYGASAFRAALAAEERTAHDTERIA
jgi:RNA polymerase sigma-70 factor (ECF subfamily)